ncbi:MAG: aspartate kinase [Candidatus Humimicrobiaceae bacterium]|jgi:aspartate kinase|nr:aspartate kinase [Actinomycetota bacterium]MDY0027711.1 aspartate kinase [Candidatus Humimicrobiaceae bacterium]
MRRKKDIVVLKFGGTSVGDTEKIKRVAEKIIRCKNEGKSVVVVVSAMGDTTDKLIGLAGEIASNPSRREMDMLVSTGECVSGSLLAMAIQEKGYKSVSLTGGQAGIVTDELYSNAKILNIRTERILKELRRDRIVIVAGFQGVDIGGNITTLGRGGSDTTAVALATALKAKYCEIYTDVEGVYSADPNMVGEAKKLESISYDEMLELASSGAKVIHLRAVEFAKKNNVILHIRSSFNDNEGTWVMDDFKKDVRMERPVITGVTYDVGEAKVSIFGLEDKPGIAADLFGRLAEKNINVDLIVQNVSEKNIAAISFTIGIEDVPLTKKVLKKMKNVRTEIDTEIAKVSIIGAGMQSNPGVAAKMFKILAEKDINIEMISTSPIRISCVIKENRIKEAVKALHTGFGLA